jgi:transposase
MAQPSYQHLLDENAQLGDENRQLRAENAQLKNRIAQLESQVEQLQSQVVALQQQVRQLTAQLQDALRASKRQAAPFSKGPPKDHPKPPGRKAGPDYGTNAHRPIPDQPPDEVIDVPLPKTCPHCGGPTVEDRQANQFQAEIPRKPTIRRFDIHIGHCRQCGKRIQPRHPLQTSDALGAAASQLGPDAQAAIVHLNKQAGLSHGKIAYYFMTTYGIYLTPGGVCQAMLRAARRCEPLYQQILASVPQAPWVVPDETGWRIGGLLAWMHAVVTPLATVYHVARGRGYEVAEQLIGANYCGTMIHDGWAPYDRFVLASHQQCLDHLLRRSKALLEVATRGAVHFPRQVGQLLADALALRDRRDDGQISPHGLAVAIGHLQSRLDRLLTWTRTDPDNERLAKHLDKHRDQLFTFLKQPGIDATNHRVEQDLRLAAVNRKVWGGNRTDRGAHAQSVLMTVWQTGRRLVGDTFRLFANILCGRRIRLPLLPAGP